MPKFKILATNIYFFIKMRKLEDYIIIQEWDHRQLRARVLEANKEGYQLFGTPFPAFLGRLHFNQIMVKFKPLEPTPLDETQEMPRLIIPKEKEETRESD